MELWNKVSGEHPQFKLKVVSFEDLQTDVIRRELGKRFDVVYGVFDSYRSQDTCQFLPLGQYHFCVSMPKSHRLASKKIITFPELHGETFLIQSPGNSPTNDLVRRDIEKEHPQICIADAPNHYNVDTFNYYEENDCVLLTLETWYDIHPSLVTVPLDVPYTILHGVIYSTTPNEDTRAFIEIVKMQSTAPAVPDTHLQHRATSRRNRGCTTGPPPRRGGRYHPSGGATYPQSGRRRCDIDCGDWRYPCRSADRISLSRGW